MTKVGLLSDTKAPSLPLMKLSAFHKSRGDEVKLVDTNLEMFELLYVSKVFNLNLPKINQIQYLPFADKIIKGGSGYAIEVENGREVYKKGVETNLPQEIESMYPDYALYKESKAHGFLTRGCPNNCGFCIVSKKDGICSKKVADLREFWNGQNEIKLYDANLLACEEREHLIQQLIKSNAWIDYTQGLDARFIDDDIAKLLCQTKIDMVHFAFDLVKNEERVLNGLKIFAKHYTKSDRSKRVYILTNYNSQPEEDYARVIKVKELGYTPYITIYQKGTHSRFLTDLQRWSNNMYLQRSTSFEDYIPRKDGIKAGKLYRAILEKVRWHQTRS